MAYVIDFIHCQVEAGLLLCSLLLDDGVDLNLSGLWPMSVDGCPGAADYVFRERVPVFREGQGDADVIALDLHAFHETELDNVPVALPGMGDVQEHFHYLVLFHYLTKFISLRRWPAPPSLSMRKST